MLQYGAYMSRRAALMAMITYLFRSRKDDRLNRVEGLRPGMWVHVEEPDAQEIQAL